MSRVVVKEVAYTSAARRQLGELPDVLHDACLEELRDQFQGEGMQEGGHVKALLLDDHVLRANLFVDKNGVLWVESVSAG